MLDRGLVQECIDIADRVVPKYRCGARSYPCSGAIAKRWQAAYEGALIARGADPADDEPRAA